MLCTFGAGTSGVFADNKEQSSPLQWSFKEGKEILSKVQSFWTRQSSASAVVPEGHPGIRDYQVKLLFVS